MKKKNGWTPNIYGEDDQQIKYNNDYWDDPTSDCNDDVEELFDRVIS